MPDIVSSRVEERVVFELICKIAECRNDASKQQLAAMINELMQYERVLLDHYKSPIMYLAQKGRDEAVNFLLSQFRETDCGTFLVDRAIQAYARMGQMENVKKLNQEYGMRLDASVKGFAHGQLQEMYVEEVEKWLLMGAKLDVALEGYAENGHLRYDLLEILARTNNVMIRNSIFHAAQKKYPLEVRAFLKDDENGWIKIFSDENQKKQVFELSREGEIAKESYHKEALLSKAERIKKLMTDKHLSFSQAYSQFANQCITKLFEKHVSDFKAKLSHFFDGIFSVKFPKNIVEVKKVEEEKILSRNKL